MFCLFKVIKYLETSQALVSSEDLVVKTNFCYLGCHPQSDSSIENWWLTVQRWMQHGCGGRCSQECSMPKIKSGGRMVCPAALYGTECWPAIKNTEWPFHAMGISMFHWSLGIFLLDQLSDDIVWQQWVLQPITEKMWENCLRWDGLHSTSSTLHCFLHHLPL